MTMRSSDDGGFSNLDGPSPTEQFKKFGVPAIIGLAALLFVFQNTDKVKFEYLWFDFETPMFIMLVAFALVGAVVFWGVQRRRRRAAKD